MPLLFAYNKVEFLAELGKKKQSCTFKYVYNRYNFSHKQDAFFEHFFFLSLLRCSLVYYTQPPSGTISLTLDMHLHLHSFYVYVSSYAPGKTVRTCRLV